jgi:superfamily II helicase
MKNLEYDGIEEGYAYDKSDIYYNGEPLERRKNSRGSGYIKIKTSRGLFGVTLKNALNILNNGKQTCTKCGEDKPLDSFYWRAESVFGKEFVCKPCTKKRVSRQQKARRVWKNWHKEETQELRNKNLAALQELKKPLQTYNERRNLFDTGNDKLQGVW